MGVADAFEDDDLVCLEWGAYRSQSGSQRYEPIEALRFVWGEGISVDEAGPATFDPRDSPELTFVSALWRVLGNGGSPCEQIGPRLYRPPDYAGFAVASSFTADETLELPMHPGDSLRASVLYEPGGLRYIAAPWATDDVHSAVSSLGYSPEADLDGLSSAAELAFASAPLEDGRIGCEDLLVRPTETERVFAEALVPGTDAPEHVEPLPRTVADAACVAAAPFGVFGPWEPLPVDFVMSMAGKIAEREYPNPHQFAEFARLPERSPEALLTDGLEPSTVDADLRANDDIVVATEAGRQWAIASPQSTGPGGVVEASGAFEPVTAETWLFEPATLQKGPWAWDGEQWQQRVAGCDPLFLCPLLRTGFRVTPGLEPGSIMMLGGFETAEGELPLRYVWRWDPEGWRRLPACLGDCPTGRADHAMVVAELSTGPELLVFGGRGFGSTLGDTWLFDGERWTRPSNECGTEGCPSARSQHAMAFDVDRGAAVMFGGRPGAGRDLGDTWQWTEAGGWDPLESATGQAPSPRRGHAMTYDATRDEVVLFGGASDVDGNYGDVWAWDGESWHARGRRCIESSCPAPRTGHTLVHDPTRDAVVAFGGASDPRAWELAAGPDARPAHLFRFALWASNLDDSQLDRLQITLVAGADDGGQAAAGIELLVWDGSWRTLDTLGAPSSIPSTLEFSAPFDPAWAVDVDGRGPTVTLAVVPTTAEGEDAVVASDHIVVRGRYAPAAEP